MLILLAFLSGGILMPFLKLLAFIADFSLGWGASYAFSVMFAYVVFCLRDLTQG